jgi:hypothetical protein
LESSFFFTKIQKAFKSRLGSEWGTAGMIRNIIIKIHLGLGLASGIVVMVGQKHSVCKKQFGYFFAKTSEALKEAV